MKLIAHLVVVIVLAAFAASSVAYAAGSAGMAAEMAASDAAAMEGTHCDACIDPDSGAKAILCDLVCGAGGFTAVLAPQSDAIAPGSPAAPVSSAERDFRGLASPPAKQPPRILT